jgi:hypothetical protein
MTPSTLMMKRGLFSSRVPHRLGKAERGLVRSFFNHLMPTIQTADPATDVLTKFDFFDSAERPTYAALSESSNVPVSTL